MTLETESHGVQDQTDEAFSVVYENCDHWMISIKTNSERIPYVERCRDCGFIDGRALEASADQIIKQSLSARAARIAVAVESEPFAFAQSSQEDLSLEEILGQALGAASTCWEEKAVLGAGVFDSTRATAVMSALLAEVQRFQRLALQDAATRAVEFVNSRSGLVPEKDLDALRKTIEGTQE